MKDSYSPPLAGIVKHLRSRGAFPLVPKQVWDPNLNRQIADLQAAATHVQTLDYFHCLQAGFYLWNDDLEKSHSISQNIATTTASYWHGIMHRREGDYGNSKYWFRRVGDHPLFSSLQTKAERLADEYPDDRFAHSVTQAQRWDPFAYVDACQKQGDSVFLKHLQELEIQMLINHCYRQMLQ